MDVKVTNIVPTAEDYISLRLRTKMGAKNPVNADIALSNSLFIVSLWDKETLIGLGRVVGDKGITYLISDIIVDPNYQRQGFGKKIMEQIDDYLEHNTDEYAYVCLIANKPADQLYRQFKFDYVEPLSTGMRRKQNAKIEKL